MSEIYEVVLNGVNVLTNQSVVNVFHYWDDAEYVPAIADCETLGQSFIAVVVPKVLDVLSTQYQAIDVTITAQSNQAQGIVALTPPNTGNRIGEPAPAQLAYSFKLQRTFTLTRSGGKRFSPLARQDALGNGQLESSSIVPAIAALEVALTAPLGGTQSAQPVVLIIWGRIKNNLPVSIINPVAYARFTEATTQKSRQRGVGS